MKKYLAEAIGTGFLVLVVGLSGDPLVVGIALAIIVYATSAISGGHVNPAVTLGLLINKKIKLYDAVNYWVAQIVGALVGALIYWVLKWTTMVIMPMDGISMWKAWLGEFIFTFMLVMVVYLTAAYKKTEGNQYRGFAIGLTVFVGAASVGRMTGGAFNPAVATGSILVDRVHGGDSGIYLWMYLVATLLAGRAAGQTAKGITESN